MTLNRRIVLKGIGIAGVATVFGTGVGAANGPGKGVAPGEETIAEIADAAGFDLLLAAVDYIAETNPDSELVAGLLNDEQYTVFAPTDDAFTALLEAIELESFADIDEALGAGTVEAVVSYHVTTGRRASNSVVPPRGERRIETLLDGARFTVNAEGAITAVGNTATIVDADISASNGIIHVIDSVLLPLEL
ncbi:fasciclin domain-containing protein [Natronosalvus vescus]|uniref:fasciclin domain-containing protein n=1 Tax=Natronosalvus vescus TaxID=2953881 RepID=UPI002091669C|nr:fasciclin domain-containing protein [Natronosalvus vescus]